MKETTEAMTWSTKWKPGDFSPKKWKKKTYQEKKPSFFSFQLAGTFKIRAKSILLNQLIKANIKKQLVVLVGDDFYIGVFMLTGKLTLSRKKLYLVK